MYPQQVGIRMFSVNHGGRPIKTPIKPTADSKILDQH